MSEINVVKNINETLSALVAVGTEYLEKNPRKKLNFFHHNQPAAEKLVALGNNPGLSDEQKVNLVKETIGIIYHKDFRNTGASTLLQSIHKVLMQADDFKPYQEKYKAMHIKGVISSLADFRAAADTIKPNRNSSVELPTARQT